MAPHVESPVDHGGSDRRLIRRGPPTPARLRRADRVRRLVRDRRRSRRRRVGRNRTTIVALGVGAVVVAVVVVGSIAHVGPASVPFQGSVARGFATLATPIARSSNATGADLASTMSGVAATTRDALFTSLDQAAADASDQSHQMAAAGSPPTAAGTSQGCVTAMAGRAQGSADVRDGIEGVLGGPTGTSATADDEPSAVRLLEAAGSDFARADAAWAACRTALRRQASGARVPESAWVSDQSAWATVAVQGYVAGLVGLPGLAPAPDLVIVTLTTVPSALVSGPGPGVLPPSASLVLVVVVSNHGNVDEPRVRVAAEASAVGGGPAPGPAVGTRVDVAVGQSQAVTLPAISVRPGGTYAVTVTASGESGGPSPVATLTVAISSPPATTTTTVVVPTTTTVVERTTTTTRRAQ